jgi:hypothetical protein
MITDLPSSFRVELARSNITNNSQKHGEIEHLKDDTSQKRNTSPFYQNYHQQKS